MEDIIICGNEVTDYVQFDKFKDISEVSQTGFVDLVSAFANHSVPANIESDDLEFNNVDDPSVILRKPKDTFEAMQFRQTISDYKSSSNNSGVEAVE